MNTVPAVFDERPYTAALSDASFFPNELVRQWRRLAGEGPCAEPFFQPEWFSSFIEAFEWRSRAVLITVRRSGRLRGVLPLMRHSRFFGGLPARALISVGNLHSCRYDFVHGKDDRTKAAAAAWSALAEDDTWDVIEALDVPGGGAFEDILDCAAQAGFHTAVWSTRKSPYLPVPGPPHDAFSNCPQRFSGSRSRLRAKQRKLARLGNLHFEVNGLAHLPAFFQLEASGWKRNKGSAIALHQNLVRLYSLIAREAENRGELRLYTLRLDGRPIAMHFGLMMGKRYYIPKVAYDETYAAYSPGLLLVREVIEQLNRQNEAVFDFLGPRMEWKSMWTERVQEHKNCYIFRPGARSRLLYLPAIKCAAAAREVKRRFLGDPQAVHTEESKRRFGRS